MLKFRNIVIILLAMLIAISTICMIIEANLVTNAARMATTYTQIAAECALKSATMTDEFFTSGTSKSSTYATGVGGANLHGGGTIRATAGSSGLLIDVSNNTAVDRFTRDEWATNIYGLTFGINGATMAPQVFTEKAYKAMYSTESFKNWSGAILDAVYSGTDTMRNTLSTRPIRWTDTYEYAPSGTWKTAIGTVAIPKLLTMGTKLFVLNGTITATDLYTELKGTNVFSSSSQLTSNFFGQNAYSWNSLWSKTNNSNLHSDKTKALLRSADYWEYKRQTSITLDRDDFGDLSQYGSTLDVDYYYTPTSLGLTYIDEDMLDILFRSNLDLLMRCGYLENGNLVGYSPQIDPGYYNDLDNATTGTANWANCVVNNGQFYYLRGKPTKVGNKLTYKDLNNQDCTKPTVEYYYIPICDETSTQINGSTVTLQETASALNTNAQLRNILYRAIDPAVSISGLADKLDSGNDKHTYEIVVAKVTFYADFLYPFKTSTLRGMAHWWGDQATGTGLGENEILGMGITEELLDNINPTYTVDEVSALDGSVQYKYTTYYAISV